MPLDATNSPLGWGAGVGVDVRVGVGVGVGRAFTVIVTLASSWRSGRVTNLAQPFPVAHA